MVAMYSEALSWWNVVGVVHVLLAKVANRRKPVRWSWLLEVAAAHLELHGAVAIGIAHMWGRLTLAIRRETGHLG